MQFASNNTVIGGRGYFILTEISGNIPILPYAGAGFNWILSEYLKGGFTTGGFAGVEVLVTRNIGIGADAGLYYVYLWSSQGNIGDIGLILNLGATYYF